MKQADVRANAFAMPLTSPAFPPRPYHFVNREFLVTTYRTDMDALRAVVPEPLPVTEPLVKYEFIRMPDATGFGDCTESGQVIPVSFEGTHGRFVHSMYPNDHPLIAGGRELRASPGNWRRRCARSRPIPGRIEGTKVPAADHSACGWHAAHLRAGALLHHRPHPEGRTAWAGLALAASECRRDGGHRARASRGQAA
jgi:hypothetical protein